MTTVYNNKTPMKKDKNVSSLLHIQFESLVGPILTMK